MSTVGLALGLTGSKNIGTGILIKCFSAKTQRICKTNNTRSRVIEHLLVSALLVNKVNIFLQTSMRECLPLSINYILLVAPMAGLTATIFLFYFLATSSQCTESLLQRLRIDNAIMTSAGK